MKSSTNEVLRLLMLKSAECVVNARSLMSEVNDKQPKGRSESELNPNERISPFTCLIVRSTGRVVFLTNRSNSTIVSVV